MAIPRVLTVQDISCVGRCSMTVALPILAACGVEACPLPTAVLSTHTGGFGKPHIADLTDHMLPMAEHWERAGLKFDVISCGYLGSKAQMQSVDRIFDLVTAPDCAKIIDPVMADHGKLYSGFDMDFVAEMKQFCAKADWLLPNITEACLLTDTEYRGDYDREWVEDLLNKLSDLGCGHILLTGVSLEKGKLGVMGYDSVRDEYFSYYTKHLPVSFHGTGDVFASTCVGAIALEKPLLEALSIAADYTVDCI